jgi:Phage tail protein (Tail_P2_I)
MTRPVVSVTAERLYAAMGPFQTGDDSAGWPLLYLCDAITQPGAEIEGYAADTDTQVGWQQMLDPTLCPARALPFLAQWVGAIVPVGSSDATARAIVQHNPGFARGTPAAIIAAAQLWLTGAQQVLLTERYGGDAYAVQMIVYTPQVIDFTALTAAVKAAMPAGFLLTLTELPGWTIAQLQSEHPGYTWVTIGANWATMTALSIQAP